MPRAEELWLAQASASDAVLLGNEPWNPFNDIIAGGGAGTGTDTHEHPSWEPANSWASRISAAYCRNRDGFAFGLALLILFVFIATAMNVHYQCWQWRTDPIASAVIERRKRHLYTPYTYFATQ